jgi:predicted ribosomally synthesized peptide with nif11-like leader
MSNEAIRAFREMLNTSEPLRATLRGAVSAEGIIDREAIAKIGRENGFDVTAGDVDAVLKQPDGEMSELELELVAGGSSISQG